METKIKNTVPFNLGVGDTNHGQNLCAGKYKMLVKEIKDQNTWRDILRSWIGRQHNKGVNFSQIDLQV